MVHFADGGILTMVRQSIMEQSTKYAKMNKIHNYLNNWGWDAIGKLCIAYCP